MIQGEHRVAATLGYPKYFHTFDPEFYMEMLVDMGYPRELAKIQLAVYADCTRHIKVMGSYGEPIKPECGMGRGDPVTLIAATATVAVEFNKLLAKALHRR